MNIGKTPNLGKRRSNIHLASLRKAVNIAKDVRVGGVPDRLNLRGVPVGDGLIPDTFAEFFESKLRSSAHQGIMFVRYMSY